MTDGPVYLYGLHTESADRVQAAIQELSGVTDAVEAVQLETGSLICGRCVSDDIRPKRRLMLAHTRVLEAALECGTLLPMRFGMVAASMAEVETIVASQRSLIEAEFARLADQLEFGVRVNFDTDAALAHQLERQPELRAERNRLSGRVRIGHFEQAEFGRRLGEALDRYRTEMQRNVVSALRRNVRDLVLRAPEQEAQVLAADVLVSRDDQADLSEVLSEIAEKYSLAPGTEPTICLVGPIPTYSFVRISLSITQGQAA